MHRSLLCFVSESNQKKKKKRIGIGVLISRHCKKTHWSVDRIRDFELKEQLCSFVPLVYRETEVGGGSTLRHCSSRAFCLHRRETNSQFCK